jgi:hypothetical protein
MTNRSAVALGERTRLEPDAIDVVAGHCHRDGVACSGGDDRAVACCTGRGDCLRQRSDPHPHGDSDADHRQRLPPAQHVER